MYIGFSKINSCFLIRYENVYASSLMVSGSFCNLVNSYFLILNSTFSEMDINRHYIFQIYYSNFLFCNSLAKNFNSRFIFASLSNITILGSSFLNSNIFKAVYENVAIQFSNNITFVIFNSYFGGIKNSLYGPVCEIIIFYILSLKLRLSL